MVDNESAASADDSDESVAAADAGGADATVGESDVDMSVPMFHPGHRMNVYVEANDDKAANGRKPFVAIQEVGGHRYPPVGFDTCEAANEWADEKIRRADQGLRATDKSNWD